MDLSTTPLPPSAADHSFLVTQVAESLYRDSTARCSRAVCVVRLRPDLAPELAGAGDLSPHHGREPRGQAPSDEDHVTATAGGHP